MGCVFSFSSPEEDDFSELSEEFNVNSSILRSISSTSISQEDFENLPPSNLPKITYDDHLGTSTDSEDYSNSYDDEDSMNNQMIPSINHLDRRLSASHSSTRTGTEQFKVILLGDAGVGKSSLVNRYETNTFNSDMSKTIGIEFSNCYIEIDTMVPQQSQHHHPIHSSSSLATPINVTSPSKSLPATQYHRMVNNNHNNHRELQQQSSFNLSSRTNHNHNNNISNGMLLVKQKQRVQLQLWDAAGELNYSDIRKVYYQGCHAVVLVYNVCDERSFLHIKNEWLSEVNAFLNKSIQISNNKSRTKLRQHVIFTVIANQIDNDSKRVVHFQAGQEFANSIDAQYFETSARTGQNVKILFNHLAKQLHEYFSQYNQHTT